MPAFSPSFDRALMVSALVHGRQSRKGTLVPYVIHPFHVALILERHGFGATLVVAALLHDVLEDVRPEDADVQRGLRDTFREAMGTAPKEPDSFKARLERFLADEFGCDVMALVEAVTEPKASGGGQPIPWAERKRRTMEQLRRPGLPVDVLALKAADVLHNVRSIERDVRLGGLQALDRFRGTPPESLRYYAGVAKVAAGRLGAGHPLVAELRDAVRLLAQAVDEASGDPHESMAAAVRDVMAGANA